jgi:hypothetical protein
MHHIDNTSQSVTSILETRTIEVESEGFLDRDRAGMDLVVFETSRHRMLMLLKSGLEL